MKILWIAPYYYESNKHPAPWISTLADYLSQQEGIQLTILNNSHTISEDVKTFRRNNIDFIYIKSPRARYDILTLGQYRIWKNVNYLKKICNDFDLIHIHGSEHQYEVAASKINIPKILSIQGIISEYIKIIPKGFSGLYLGWSITSYYEKKYSKCIKNFSCRTHWDQAWVEKINPSAKIYHNWEMIRPQFFSDHFSEKKEKILFMGGTNGIKGYRELLMAFNKVKEKINIKLIMIGHADPDDISDIIKEHNLVHIKTDDIECRGFQNIDGILQAYDESFCFVHPSYIDNSPNSVCEAQIAGLPVIATDVGGVSSLIEDRKTGLLVKLDYNDIASKIIELYEDDLLRKSISECSKKVARERHNPETILAKTIDIYKQICN